MKVRENSKEGEAVEEDSESDNKKKISLICYLSGGKSKMIE